MNKVSDNILRRVYVLFALFILLGAAILIQVIRIQHFSSKDWAAEGRKSKIYPKKIVAARGSILADDGSILATSLPFFRFAMDVTVIKKRNYANWEDSLSQLCYSLAHHFGDETYTQHYFRRLIQNALDTKDSHIYLFKSNKLFDYHDMKLIRSFPILNKGRYKGGLLLERVNHRRFYPLGSLGKITLGRLDNDTTGGRGIEFSFNRQLRGKDGYMLVQKASNNTEIPLNYESKVESEDGFDIISTININMQDVVSSSLRRAMENTGAKSGCAILMEVSTGRIKAMANYPETYNYAVASQNEPGSTFKLASIIAALEDGIIKPDDIIDVKDGVKHFRNVDMKDETIRGKLTFKSAFEKSSNIAIATVINDYYSENPEKFINRLKRMGILSKQGFQLKGEPKPYLIKPKDKEWNHATLPWLAIGYNVKITPLQLLTLYNAIANGGQMIQPIIVSEIKNNSGVTNEYRARIIRQRICSKENLPIIQSFLEGVVERGTARSIKDAHYPIAGKSGTAKKIVDGQYVNKYRASFVGYFPANAPQYSLLVMVDEPQNGNYYGSRVAAPVFREIVNNIHSALLESSYRDVEIANGSVRRVPSSRVVHQEDARIVYAGLNLPFPKEKKATDYIQTKTSGDKLNIKAYSVKNNIVPDMYGLCAKDAIVMLENMGLQVIIKGQGHVRKQSLRPGRPIKNGEIIILSLN